MTSGDFPCDWGLKFVQLVMPVSTFDTAGSSGDVVCPKRPNQTVLDCAFRLGTASVFREIPLSFLMRPWEAHRNKMHAGDARHYVAALTLAHRMRLKQRNISFV